MCKREQVALTKLHAITSGQRDWCWQMAYLKRRVMPTPSSYYNLPTHLFFTWMPVETTLRTGLFQTVMFLELLLENAYNNNYGSRNDEYVVLLSTLYAMHLKSCILI